MKKGFLIFIALISLCFISCDAYFNFIDGVDNYIETVNFQSENYQIMSGNIQICNIVVNPTDAIDYYDTEFLISNTEVAFIKSSTNKSCTIEGRQKGNAIITAKIGNKECQAVINVM